MRLVAGDVERVHRAFLSSMSRSTWASGVESQYCSLYRGAVAHHVSDGAIGHEQPTFQQLPNTSGLVRGSAVWTIRIRRVYTDH